jgi:hypothetical protein
MAPTLPTQESIRSGYDAVCSPRIADWTRRAMIVCRLKWIRMEEEI